MDLVFILMERLKVESEATKNFVSFLYVAETLKTLYFVCCHGLSIVL